MSRFWEHTPPAALQLKRIALWVGLTPNAPAQPAAQTPAAAIDMARTAGIPVAEGRPDDPYLDLIGW